MNPSENTNRLRTPAGQRHSSDSGTIVLFIIAALMVLFALLHWAVDSRMESPLPEARIKSFNESGLIVESKSDALGAGDIALHCDPTTIQVEDVNGQQIDYLELQASDAIRVSISKEKCDGQPVVDRIILLPNDISVYI